MNKSVPKTSVKPSLFKFRSLVLALQGEAEGYIGFKMDHTNIGCEIVTVFIHWKE